ncbi:MAG: hypothetical protein ACLGHN_01610 [Bacteriovoracia bacterium]
MNNSDIDPALFETLIHLLELSVVVGIGVIVYITKKYSGKINKEIERKVDEMDSLSGE